MTGSLLRIVLGDIIKIERNIEEAISEHDPEQRFSTYYDYRYTYFN